MSVKKDLNFYKNLEYKIITEAVIDEFGKEYIAYCYELGKYSCYGTGKTQIEAIEKFIKDKNEFIELLIEQKKPIPEPIIQSEESLPNGTITFRTLPVLHKQLLEQAKQNSVSLNLYMNYIVNSASVVNDVKSELKQEMRSTCERIEANFTNFYRWAQKDVQFEREKSKSAVSKYIKSDPQNRTYLGM
jgi:predicted HicB family RNase H-like nuclease